ncbi:MAG: response regulator transcription factor [Candidatus Limnocylindrales bacterium]
MTTPTGPRPDPAPEPSASLLVLVVDDEPAMVGAVSALVGSAGHRVVTAYDGDAALRRFAQERPDVVLLDLAMPGRDGVDVCREIRLTSQVPIVVLSGEGDELAKVQALDAGADDYVTKPFGRQELLARIRAVTRRGERPGGRPVGLVGWGRLVIDTERHEARIGEARLSLTPIEFALLAELAAAGDRVLGHEQLLRAGWPGLRDPDPQWLKPHLARLRAKLAALGGPVPVPVRGVGYRLAEEPPASPAASG